MKVLPLTLGPIVGGTTSTRVRLWGRAAYEATPEGPRRACGVARIRSVTGGGFSDPVFFKMNPNFDLTGVVVLDSLEPETEHEYEMGYFFSDTEAYNLDGLDWSEASRSRFRTGTDDRGASRSFVMGSCRYLARLFGGTWLDARGDKIHDHWSGFPLDRAELLRFIVEKGCERVVFLSGDVPASISAELRAVGGSETKLVSIVSSPLFWPYPGGPAGLFRLEGTIRAGDLTFELAEAGPVQSADNFTRVTVHPDRVEAEVFSRKGLPLGPPKVHRF